MIVNGALALAHQIEVTVIRQVQHRRRVGHCGVVNLERVAFAQAIAHSHIEIARIALFTIGAAILQLQRATGLAGLPYSLVEPDLTAMKRVVAIVLIKLVGNAIQAELAAADPIGIAPGYGAEIRVLGFVFGQAVESQSDIGESAQPVRRSN